MVLARPQINNEPAITCKRADTEIYNSVEITESNSSVVYCTDQTLLAILYPVMITTMQK